MRLLAALAVLLLCAACGAGTPGKDAGVVTVASSFTLPGTPIQIADDRGYFREEGIRVEYVRIKATSDAIPMLARGDVDAATGSAAAGLFNALASGSDLRFVADAGTSQPGHPIWSLVVRKALVDRGTVRTFADLKGLRVALPGPGTGFDRGLSTALGKGGLTPADVHVVSPLSFPDMVTGLREGSLDAAFLIEPLTSLGVRDGVLVPLWDATTVVGAAEEGVLMFSPRFAGDRDRATGFARAYLRGVRDYLATFTEPRSAGAAEAVAIVAHVAEVTGVPQTVLEHVAAPGIDPNGAVDVADLDALQEFFVGQGSVRQKVDLARFADPSFVEEALVKVGKR